MFLSKIAIDRPVTTWVFVIVLVLMGLLAYQSIPLSLAPETNLPVVSVQIVYPGAGAEEIQNNITKKVEDEVATISDLDYFNSYVMEGASVTTLIFKTSKDENVAVREVKDKIELIANDLPDDAYEPEISKFDIASEPIMTYSMITSLSPADANDFAENNLEPRLSRITGVAEIDLTGANEREIQVVLNRKQLSKYGLSPLQLVSFLQMNNMNLPGGSIRKNGHEYSVKYEGEFKSLNDIADIQVPTPKGNRHLSELAEIRETSKKPQDLSRFHDSQSSLEGENLTVINMGVIKLNSANVVKVAEQVRADMEQLKKELPDNIDIILAEDSSTFVKNSVRDTLSSIYMGIIFTALVLLLFLHDLRSTFVVAISMPVVLIATFMLVNGAGFTLNIMSLMAMSVSVGTLVTNSVVILENIDRYIKMGMNKIEASNKGTSEIAVAVIASTVTNIVVFVPIATMQSMVGSIFKEFGLTVVFIMVLSIIISFTLTPMLASQIIKVKGKKSKNSFGKRFEDGFEKLAVSYKNSVKWVVSSPAKRFSVIIFSILILVLVAVTLGKGIGTEFVPYVDDGVIQVTAEFPAYYDLDKTSDKFMEMEKIITSHDEVDKVIVNIGSLDMTEGVYVGKIRIFLKKDREQTTTSIARIMTQELSAIPDGLIKVAEVSQFETPSKPIQFDIMGTDLEEVRKLTQQVFEIAGNVEGALNVDTDIRAGKPEYKFVPDRKKLADAGVNVYDIAMTLRTTIEGVESSTYRINGEEYDIRVLLDNQNINDEDKLRDIPILTSLGEKHLSDLGKVELTEAPTMIYRKNKLIMHSVTASIGSRTLGDIVGDIQKGIDEKITIPSEFKIEQGGDAKLQNEAMVDLSRAFLIALVLTFLLIVAILESWSQGVIIMTTIPLSLIGVITGLSMFGVALNIFAMMAVVMLIGIVVNNAIIILDYTNHLHRSGLDKVSAILEASHTKLRAIVMATLASVLGMLPLALGLGAGAELRQGVGVVSMGGLLTSAILTLYVIPVIYVQFTKKKIVNTEV